MPDPTPGDRLAKLLAGSDKAGPSLGSRKRKAKRDYKALLDAAGGVLCEPESPRWWDDTDVEADS